MTDGRAMKVVEKVWGREIWIVNDAYCGKRMVVYPGKRCSFHYHPVKDETFYVLQGRLMVRYVPLPLLHSLREGGLPDAEICRQHFHVHFLAAGDALHIPVGMPHQFEAPGSHLGPVQFIEFSTHHDDDDVVRVLQHDDLF